MSLFNYFQTVDHGGLPNPNGSLSSTVEANRLVLKNMNMTENVSETTVHSIKKAYVEELRKKEIFMFFH